MRPARPYHTLSLTLSFPSIPSPSRPFKNLPGPALLCYSPPSLALSYLARLCSAYHCPCRPCPILLAMPSSSGLVHPYQTLTDPSWPFPVLSDLARSCLALRCSTCLALSCPAMLDIPRSCPAMREPAALSCTGRPSMATFDAARPYPTLSGHARPYSSCLAYLAEHRPTLSFPPVSGSAGHARSCQVLPSPDRH